MTCLLTIVTLVAVAGCSLVTGKESDLSYAEASQRLDESTQAVLRLAIGETDSLPEPSERQGTCDSPLGGLSEYQQPVLRYELPIESLEVDAEDFLVKVTEFWEGDGASVSRRNDSLTSSVLADWDDGFNLRAMVNPNTGLVHIGGSGPCVTPPE